MHACIWLNMWGPLPCYKCYESTLIKYINDSNKEVKDHESWKRFLSDLNIHQWLKKGSKKIMDSRKAILVLKSYEIKK